MKHKLKLVLKYLYLGISSGCICFMLDCVIGFLMSGQPFLEFMIQDFPRQAAGTLIVGIACASTAFVYRIDRLSLGIKILIHFMVAMGAFCAVSFYLGWLSFASDRVLSTVLQLLIFCVGFIVIWFCFYLYNRKDAKKINERLRELEPNETERPQ